MYLDKETFLALYKAQVRPHLEYANSVWSPRKKSQVLLLENVQRRATSMIPGFKDMPYPDRLRKLGLPSLVYRRLRGDLIEIYKIVSGKYDTDASEHIINLRRNSKTRGHQYKIFKTRPKLKLKKNSFPHRVENIWNLLPKHVVMAKSLNAFEGRLDACLKHQDLKYDFEVPFNYSLLTESRNIKEALNEDLVYEAQ